MREKYMVRSLLGYAHFGLCYSPRAAPFEAPGIVTIAGPWRFDIDMLSFIDLLAIDPDLIQTYGRIRKPNPPSPKGYHRRLRIVEDPYPEIGTYTIAGRTQSFAPNQTRALRPYRERKQKDRPPTPKGTPHPTHVIYDIPRVTIEQWKTLLDQPDYDFEETTNLERMFT